MNVAKYIVVALLSLAGLGALGFGVLEGRAMPLRPLRLPVKVELRALGAAVTPRAHPESPRVEEPLAPAAVEDAGSGHPVLGVAAAPDAGRALVATKPDAGVRAPVVARLPVAVGEATLNLHATDTADVYIDGRKLGGSPQLGIKVKSGQHKVRFDCFDTAGNSTPGQPQTIVVAADEEKNIEHTCPTE